MEFLTSEHFKALSNPGVTSLQLLSPHNSRSNRVTITRVTVEAGAEAFIYISVTCPPINSSYAYKEGK